MDVNLGGNDGEENVIWSCLSSPAKNLGQEQILEWHNIHSDNYQQHCFYTVQGGQAT